MLVSWNLNFRAWEATPNVLQWIRGIHRTIGMCVKYSSDLHEIAWSLVVGRGLARVFAQPPLHAPSLPWLCAPRLGCPCACVVLMWSTYLARVVRTRL